MENVHICRLSHIKVEQRVRSEIDTIKYRIRLWRPNEEVPKTQENVKQENIFPAGDRKAARHRQDRITKTNMKHKYQKGSTEETPPWNGQ